MSLYRSGCRTPSLLAAYTAHLFIIFALLQIIITLSLNAPTACYFRLLCKPVNFPSPTAYS
ncbi:hypothetical protein, partial [Serratia sp. CY43514]|uniref:hypothetical protein n=1 Tax=Serratia sp. CY43514 TaxID=3383620 RepID=UPI0040293633